MSQRLEIWNIAQKWMTINENVKKKKKKKKNEKDEKKTKTKN